MRITGINVTYNKLPFSKEKQNQKIGDFLVQNDANLLPIVFYKDYNLSFNGKPSSKKKNPERIQKQELYKALRKQGCGEKATSSVINNDKKYRRNRYIYGDS